MHHNPKQIDIFLLSDLNHPYIYCYRLIYNLKKFKIFIKILLFAFPT